MDNHISKILRSLKVEKFYALLLHSPGQLNLKNSKFFYDYLQKLKKKGIFNKLGISVYTKNQTVKIIKNTTLIFFSFHIIWLIGRSRNKILLIN